MFHPQVMDQYYVNLLHVRINYYLLFHYLSIITLRRYIEHITIYKLHSIGYANIKGKEVRTMLHNILH